ncbi:MAG: endonuclease/exonuclease/phosphatase family protein [Myxococcales bacterium]
MTLNLWNDRADPTRRLEVVAEDLRALEPDVVALQEVREGPFLAQATTLGKLLGMQMAFGPVDAQSSGGPVGNAVLSRYPIAGAQNHTLPSSPQDPRCALDVKLKTPAGVVRVVCTHLSWEPHAALRREQQVLAIDELCQGPDDDHVLVCGDFNTAPAAAAIRFMTGCDSLAGRGTFYRDAWARKHPASTEGFTYSSENPRAVRWIRAEPAHRLRLRPWPRALAGRARHPRRPRGARQPSGGRHLAFGSLRRAGRGAADAVPGADAPVVFPSLDR